MDHPNLNLSSYHPVCKQIVDALKADSCWFEAFEHEAVRTSEEAAATREDYTLRQGAKAIIISVKRKAADVTKPSHAMLVFPADEKFNAKKVKAALGVKDVRFATVEMVAELTGGVEPGGVPPFGNLFGLDVYVAPELLQLEKIVFNAGDRRFSLGMTVKDYQKLVNPTVLNML